jgi:hypothetical protein
VIRCITYGSTLGLHTDVQYSHDSTNSTIQAQQSVLKLSSRKCIGCKNHHARALSQLPLAAHTCLDFSGVRVLDAKSLLSVILIGSEVSGCRGIPRLQLRPERCLPFHINQLDWDPYVLQDQEDTRRCVPHVPDLRVFLLHATTVCESCLGGI